MKLLLLCVSLLITLPFCYSTNKRIESSLLLSDSTYWLPAQQTVVANVFIAYPRSKDDKRYYLFFNRKKIAALDYGGRLIYSLASEGVLKISINSENLYREPSTLDRNTRTIDVKAGKDYYFQINGKGGLDYIVNAEKGKEDFNNGNFTSEKIVLSENASDSLFLK